MEFLLLILLGVAVIPPLVVVVVAGAFTGLAWVLERLGDFISNLMPARSYTAPSRSGSSGNSYKPSGDPGMGGVSGGSCGSGCGGHGCH